MRTFIHFKIRRFECEQCDYRFTEELQAVGWRRRQTQRFEKAVYERCLESDKKAVAEAFHLSQSTVHGIFKNHAERIEQAQSTDGIVRILGMDEIAIKKRHKQFALVISDLERRCVIAVLPSRELAEIVNWFLTLSQEQVQAIRTVSMDMCDPTAALLNAICRMPTSLLTVFMS